MNSPGETFATCLLLLLELRIEKRPADLNGRRGWRSLSEPAPTLQACVEAIVTNARYVRLSYRVICPIGDPGLPYPGGEVWMRRDRALTEAIRMKRFSEIYDDFEQDRPSCVEAARILGL